VRPRPRRSRRRRRPAGKDDVVDDAVVACLGGGHVVVPVDVEGHLLDRPAAVVGDDLGHPASEGQHLAQLDLHVGGRTAGAGRSLVDHDAGVRQREALPGGATAEDHGRGGHAHAHADGGDVGLDVLHHVVDGHAGVGHAPGRVDVEVDVPLVVLRLEEQHLRDDQVRHLVVDLLPQEDDPLAQERGVDVEGPVAAVALLDHGRDQDLAWWLGHGHGGGPPGVVVSESPDSSTATLYQM